GRHFPRRQVTANERLLQLEAQDDVHVVGRLVGLDADEGALDVVDGEEPVVERNVIDRAGEHLLEPGEEVLPERPGASDLVLPKARLRFVDAERDGTTHRRTKVLVIEALVVDAVTSLVQDAEKALVELTRMVARREPAVAWPDAAAKRVNGDVEPSGSEIE